MTNTRDSASPIDAVNEELIDTLIAIRTRNLPMHAPEKWTVFKSYNKRDVEVEMGIKDKLHKFPVPDFVWEEYHLDQEINDRGILVDLQMVENRRQ